MVSEGLDEPAIPPALRRPLAAVWISLGLHGAVIALVQVAPPAVDAVGTSVIEARLVSSHAESARPRNAPPKTPPPRAPERASDQPKPALTPTTTAAAPSTSSVEVPSSAPSPAPSPTSAPPPVLARAGALAPAPVATTPAAITSAVDLTYYSAGELDVPPRPLRKIDADYPRDAEARGLSGEVRLRVRIEADGRVSNVDIVSVEPAGYAFEGAAREAFKRARFVPARKNGRIVRAEVLIKFVFDWTEER